MDINTIEEVIICIAQFRDSIAGQPDRLLLTKSPQTIREAAASGRLAIAFDLEGAKPLMGEPAMVQLYADLGVRQMHLVYNRSNEVGSGCHDPQDLGLSNFGRKIIREMTAAGVVLDVSHASERTSLEMIEASSFPVVFSHTNVRALHDHPRNISDRQIRECAANGGVIGVTGQSLLTGTKENITEAIATHIDYIVERVGVEYVGLGLDYCYETGIEFLSKDFDFEYWWPARWGYLETDNTMGTPCLLRPLIENLSCRGYDDEAIAAILGGNFLRVAETVWN